MNFNELSCLQKTKTKTAKYSETPALGSSHRIYNNCIYTEKREMIWGGGAEYFPNPTKSMMHSSKYIGQYLTFILISKLLELHF